ncbi:RHS repeat-associated core domain-containing protein [Anoxybacteroides rupiense]|uniref:RHS repeat-associated core domain-containing protein n=2 Tax=Anoxybacteroides rupiense TaxID=311460 RepID=UPI0016059D89|nr:RHS repeat-associated core domain-containing protein [Anoxybacillus rupiensis]MBB3909370.1 RHS repeat-associated protein [Anoxybacillus rupiensis]
MDLRYTYDVDGNIVTCFDGADSYTYDFANRLKSWTYQGNTVQYDYDASGNLKNPHGKTLTFNAANEIEGFTYDDAGNLLKDDRYQYTWDGEGRLLSVKDVNGNTVASFTYRPDGLRETKTVNGVTYHYHYDGSDLIRVTDDSGQTVWAFTWANGKPNTVTNANGDTFYYVTNYRGDVVRIIDENGATVANYSYDPWGKVLSVSENAAVAGQPIGYAGYYYDRETKLYYLQARYYDPETARFISRDPDPGDKDDPITQNAYTYANDNPVMLVDPDGNYAIAVGVYFIPGIGEVALLATGAVVLGGITYKAGSWIANKVKTYQSKKS